MRRRGRAAFAALSPFLVVLPCARSQQQCDPCAGTDITAFRVKPGTACKVYTQCVQGVNFGDFECSGDTIYDEAKQYCNWPSDTECVETTCPPTRQPSTGQPTLNWEDCVNPCPQGFTGFRTRPGTLCKKYVQCENGVVMEELECFGDTLFNDEVSYCDWPDSYACSIVSCPEREPTELPTEMPTPSPVKSIPAPVPDQPVIVVEPADCPNPCPADFTGFATRPGWQCTKYVQCQDGAVADELECQPDTIFDPNAQFCQWTSSASCGPTPCPAQREPPPVQVIVVDPDPKPTDTGGPDVVGVPVTISVAPVASVPVLDEAPSPLPVPSTDRPTSSPAAEISFVVPEIPVITVGKTTSQPYLSRVDCPNPCPAGYSGLTTKPDTNCMQYVQCENGEINGILGCPDGAYFVEESGDCESGLGDEWTCPPVLCPVSNSSAPKTPEIAAPAPTPRTSRPTTQRPTPIPAPTYQDFRSYLAGREDELNSIVFQSNGSPSTAYTFPDFLSSLDVATFQVPADKSFFVGEGMSGRLPKLTGVEYGLVNLAAFLSNAMEEGIRFDSCDEQNTDFMFDGLREKYPLANACGQYGRSYEDEACPGNEPYQCAVDRTMQVTAVDKNGEKNAPPFTCRPKEFDGLREIFPGYYDSVDDAVKQSAYANSVGRTDIEGCCWWGRGVLLTRGTCMLGKMSEYLGKGAVDRGVFVYPDVDFCATPSAICDHPRSNELRFVLGMLEWSDRVSSYVDENSGWSYMDQLKQFVDEGMADDTFINGAINIFTRKCHDDSCEDQWVLDDDSNVSVAVRRDNFRQIIFEVFNLPMTYQPTDAPHNSPTLSPTVSPTITRRPTDNPTTNAPTGKPTRRRGSKPDLAALPPNSGQLRRVGLWALAAACICVAAVL